MNTIRRITPIATIAAALLIVGCSSTGAGGDDGSGDGNGADNGTTGDAPSAEVESTESYQAAQSVSTTMSSVSGEGSSAAILASTTVSAGLGLTGLTDFANPESGLYGDAEASADGSQWSYTATDGELTITLTVTESSDAYSWEVTYDGTADDGADYDDFTVFEGQRAVDQTSGSFTFYDEDAPSRERVSREFSWNQGDRYTWTYTSYSYADDSVDSTTRYRVVIDPDRDGGTGELDLEERSADGELMGEYSAGWDQGGSNGIITSSSDSVPEPNFWGAATSDTDPDGYLSNDELEE